MGSSPRVSGGVARLCLLKGVRNYNFESPIPNHNHPGISAGTASESEIEVVNSSCRGTQLLR